MQHLMRKRHIAWLLVAVGLLTVNVTPVLAISSKSTNFEISEPEFGAGSALETCSGQYCAKASIGDMTVDQPAVATDTAAFGAIATDSEPLLEVIIEPGTSDLGILSADRTATKTTVIKIRNYESSGYTLQVVGSPPVYESHTLQAPSQLVASQPGVEQFALNAVANTTPSVGQNPKQTPDASFSYGYVLPDYAVPNQFKYENGGVIARSDTESGQTEYTISMIINVAGSTPAGHFTTDFAAVVIPVF